VARTTSALPLATDPVKKWIKVAETCRSEGYLLIALPRDVSYCLISTHLQRKNGWKDGWMKWRELPLLAASLRYTRSKMPPVVLWVHDSCQRVPIATPAHLDQPCWDQQVCHTHGNTSAMNAEEPCCNVDRTLLHGVYKRVSTDCVVHFSL